MNKVNKDNFKQDKYKYGFVTDIESEKIPKGLNKDVIKLISKKKEEPEWMLEWRLKAFERLQNMNPPKWVKAKFDDIDFQDLYLQLLHAISLKNQTKYCQSSEGFVGWQPTTYLTQK